MVKYGGEKREEGRDVLPLWFLIPPPPPKKKGVIVALASGIGVALALTDGGINCMCFFFLLFSPSLALVGVAISASILPPLVNSGMCFSAGLLGRFLIGEYNHDVCCSIDFFAKKKKK